MRIEQIDPATCIPELVDLAAVEYGDAEIANGNYLNWQYLENPAGEAIIVVARSEDGQLAGQYVVIPTEFRVGSERIKGSVSLNTLTHPDFRGQGLFTKMANETYAACKREGLKLTLGYPNRNSYPGFVRKLQFRHIGNATVMFRPLRVLKLAASLSALKGAEKYAASELEDWPVNDFRSRAGSIELLPLDFQEDSVAYDELANSIQRPRYSVHKSAAFASWRYDGIPTRRYQAFQARDESGMKAVCVARQRKVKGIECVFLVDFINESGAAGLKAGERLLKAVLQHFRNCGVALAGMMMNRDTQVHRLARSTWFREMPSRLLPHDAPIILRRNDGAAQDSIFDIDNWAFSFGDYDVF